MGQRFSTTIVKIGINPCVDVPARVSTALGKKGYIPVRGTINGHVFRAGLVSLGGGRHRLFINGEMRENAGVDVGDSIDVVLDYDSRPRKLDVPRLFSDALKSDPIIKDAWENLTPSRRKEILNYLSSLKRPETLARSVQKVVDQLRPAT